MRFNNAATEIAALLAAAKTFKMTHSAAAAKLARRLMLLAKKYESSKVAEATTRVLVNANETGVPLTADEVLEAVEFECMFAFD